jgi:orotate phosphoribosyltransferase
VTEAEVKQILEETDAVITGSHVVYSSRRHGSAYVNKDAVYAYPEAVSQLCRSIAHRFYHKDQTENLVQVVVAPAVGGISLATWTAYHLGKISTSVVQSLYADKEGTGFVLKRGYDERVKGKRVLVVEDILTTGLSVRKVVETVRLAGGDVIGVCALVNRGGVTAEQVGGVPRLEALLHLSMDSFEAGACPHCRSGVPINTKVGHGKQFLAEKAE